jgi:hypothetical protein
MSRPQRKHFHDASLLSTKVLGYPKVAQVAHLQVLGKVEDERTFRMMSFLKSKLRNHQLTVAHIDLVVRMFPNQQAITDWKAHEVSFGGGELKEQGTTTNLWTL